MTVVTMIRHGEPIREVVDTHYGDDDVPLSDLGRAQSAAVADRLAAEEFDAIWSSNLARATYLGERLAASRGLTVQIEPALRERGVGILQGMTYAEADAAYPEESRDLRENSASHRVPGGENMTNLAARVLPALTRILAAHEDQGIAIAGHGGSIRVVLGHVLGLPIEHLFRMRLDYCRVSTVEFRADGRMRVLRMNA
jgi:broad specificity phosphatase PhoE